MAEGNTSGWSLTKPVVRICLPGFLAFSQPVPPDPFLPVLPFESPCPCVQVLSERPHWPFPQVPAFRLPQIPACLGKPDQEKTAPDNRATALHWQEMYMGHSPAR